MALAYKLKKIYPDIDLLKDCRLVDDGTGAKIVEWTYPKKKPTKAQLAALDDNVLIQEAQNTKNRRISYPAITDQLDALLKQFKAMRLADNTSVQPELADIIDKWEAVKVRYPKTEQIV